MTDEERDEREQVEEDASDDLELADEEAKQVVGGADPELWNWRK